MGRKIHKSQAYLTALKSLLSRLQSNLLQIKIKANQFLINYTLSSSREKTLIKALLLFQVINNLWEQIRISNKTE